jgi:hypothetical protein
MMSQTENLYKVILPFNSHIVHSSKSINDGASKCYKEIKKQMGGVDLFSIMNINSNKVYNFQTKSNKKNQNGGFLSNLNEIKTMNDSIKILESRIISLENITNKLNKLDHTNISKQNIKDMIEENILSGGVDKNSLPKSDLEVFSKLDLESKQKKLIESLQIL